VGQSQDTVIVGDVSHEPEYLYDSDSDRSSTSTEGEEHWDVGDDVLKELDHDTITEIIRDLDSDDSTCTSKKGYFLHIILLFLFLWTSFYGISATALNHLIAFFSYISSFAANPATVTALAAVFPSSLYIAQKYLDIQQDRFEKFVICQRCSSLYNYKDCFETTGTRKRSKHCSHIEYRNHPQPSQRRPCGHRLIKEIITKKEKKFYPIKSYPYCSIMDSLSHILSRTTFLEQCEHW